MTPAPVGGARPKAANVCATHTHRHTQANQGRGSMHGETWTLPPVRQHDEVALDTPLERFVLKRDRKVSMATTPIADGSNEPSEGLPEGAARGSRSLSRRRPASRAPNRPEARDGRTQSSFSLRIDA